MIFDILKQRWLRKEFYQLENSSRDHDLHWPKSMVILFDATHFKDIEMFKKWAKNFDVPFKKLTLIGCTKDANKEVMEGVTLFDHRAIKWMGGLKDMDLAELLAVTYDLQINYYEAPSQVTTYISMKLDARIKAGHVSHKEATFNLAVNVPLKNQELFISEITKYLKILTT